MKEETQYQYRAALAFFSGILQDSPDPEMLRTILEGGLFEDTGNRDCFRYEQGLSLFGKDDPDTCLCALADAYPKGVYDAAFYRGLYLQLHEDHLALFSGPQPKAPPWESVWRERDGLLFGDQTEKVAQFYADWGIVIENSGREPEDHLGLELAFTLFLFQTMNDDPDAAAHSGLVAGEALPLFLEAHVLPWAGDCLKKASEEASSVFYRETPKLCLWLVNSLYEAATKKLGVPSR